MNNSIREELVKYAVKTVSSGLVAGAGGNVSARENNTIWMKPSGLAIDEITPDNLCGMDLESGEQKSGDYKPTSEVNMHLAVYRQRPDVKAVFHTHSPWASGVISAGVELKPMFAEFIADLGTVGTIPYITPTTQNLADAMKEKVASCDTVLMINHGVLAVGKTVRQAFFRCLVVEDAGKSQMAATVVGTPQFLTQEQIEELKNLNAVKHRMNVMTQQQ
jgi:L-fuculose-phosphate aldolase